MKKFRLPFVFVSALLVSIAIFFTVRKPPVAFQYPGLEQFSGIVSEAGLTQWEMEEVGREIEGSEEWSFSEARLYELHHQEQQLRCQFFFYLSHAGNTGLTICFLPVDMNLLTENEYEQLLGRGFPELWMLASKICSDPHAMLDLQKQMEAAYGRAAAPEQYADRMAYVGEWGAQCSGIYATARLVRQDAFSRPMWYQIKLVGEAEYNDSRSLGEYTLSDTQALSRIGMGEIQEEEKREKLRKKYAVQGRLTEITEAGDFQFCASTSFNLPKNMSFYQKAVLTDESGSLPVYIAPTALSREELGRERLHLVQAVRDKNDKLCYVISRSCLKE